MKLITLTMSASLLFGTIISAQAATVCGEKTHKKFGETRIYSRDYIATCRHDGSCAAVAYKLNPDTKKADAPLGWDHRMTISRFSKTGPWKITFTAVTAIPDVSEGIRIAVDKDGGNKVVSEFLRREKAVNDISVDTKLSDIFLNKFKKGSKVRWTYSIKNGETTKTGATEFSLLGLNKAMKWADCAQNLGGF